MPQASDSVLYVSIHNVIAVAYCWLMLALLRTDWIKSSPAFYSDQSASLLVVLIERCFFL
jgi:hypothetical protein